MGSRALPPFGSECTPWDGSLISVPSSSRDTSPEARGVRHSSTDGATSLQNSQEKASPDGTQSSLAPSGASPLEPAPASPALSTHPDLESQASPSGAAEDKGPGLNNPFRTAPREDAHPQPFPHLATYLFSEVSPPGSPASAFSFSRTNPPSIDGGSGSPRTDAFPGGRWTRRRSSTNGSSSRSTSGSAASDLSGGGLVMPSMRLPLEQHDSHDGAASSSAGGGGDSLRLLLLGRSSEERQTLARLLAPPFNDGETDLSMSLLSARLSERSRNSSRHVLSGDLDELVEELPYRGSQATFFHPPSTLDSPADLAARLVAPLEQLDAILNPLYPSSRRLAEIATSALKGELDACLMLFSSPPLPSEVAFARSISHAGLPIFPVLILPPPPTSRPQKTSALVAAVSQQLTGAGVRWCSAFEPLTSTKPNPLYLLPAHLFYPHDDGDSSVPSSLSSSQELRPPSPSASARSASPATKGDLKRLRDLVSAASARERLRRNRTIAFLEWREIETAARGHTMWHPSVLPAVWHDAETNEGERKEQLRLDFSRRVAERRAALALQRFQAESEVRDDASQLTDEDEDDRVSLHSLSAGDSGEGFHASYLTDPTTPRCAQQTLPLFLQELDPFYPTTSGAQQDLSDSICSTASLVASTPSSYGAQAMYGVDPFHLPSLLHLVGLNLRLHLLPAPAVASEKQSRRGVGPWLGTAVLWGALFVAGVFCGSGKAGTACREVLKAGSRFAPFTGFTSVV